MPGSDKTLFQHVFVLCTGRCGSQTFVRACEHFTNYSAGHETRTRLTGPDRLAYPHHHIEADNRLSWMLGRVQRQFGAQAFYVHLTRDAARVADSYDQRWDHRFSLIDGYNRSILMHSNENPEAAQDMVDTINANIEAFLADKPNVMRIDIDNPVDDFRRFVHMIGATGDLDAAVAEFGTLYNAGAAQPALTGAPRARMGQMSTIALLKAQRDTLERDKNDLQRQFERAIAETARRSLSLDRTAKLLCDALERDKNDLQRQLDHAIAETARRSESLDRTAKLLRDARKLVKRQKEKAARQRRIGMVLAAPTLLMLAPVLVPYLAYRKLRKPRAAKGSKATNSPALVERATVMKASPTRVERATAMKASPTRVERATVMKAFVMFRDTGVNAALAYIGAHKNSLPPATDALFRAMAAPDDPAWLLAFNKWGGSRGLAPVSLDDGDLPRFQRIRFPRLATLTDVPKVSVIMPCYNCADTVKLAVRSILDQSWSNLEVICVNDASADGTADALDELARSDARVKVLHNPVNVGPYVSKNAALALATGQYVTGHDADDIAVPDRIARQMQPIMDDPAIKATIGHMIRLDANARPNFISKTSKVSHDGIARIAFISLLIEREFFDAHLGAWDCVRFGADSELLSRLNAASGEPHVLRDTIMLCLSTENGLTGNSATGLDAVTGLSPVRAAYRDAWQAWHRTLAPGQTRLAFPPADRAYEAPAEMHVPDDAINAIVQQLAKDKG